MSPLRQWRSLEELAGTEDFRQWLENEFAPGASEWSDPVGRRELLKLLGATLGLAGLTGCTREPPEKIVPHVRAPEEHVPGHPLYYATALPFGGIAQPVLVESHMGRPTKVEGNPEHPASLGATDVFSQAAILGLYDPDRSQVVVRNGRISSWVSFAASMSAVRENYLARRGQGLRILTETVTSPSMVALLGEILKQFPLARWHRYDAVGLDNARAGARLAFGEPVHTVHRVDQADVIVSLDADFLYSAPGAVRAARDFARRRDPGGRVNRLYVIEPAPTITGASADHRLALPASAIEGYARALAAAAGVPVEA
ncbi:MAG: TAT-variant-translocated molybdopterin oxidoreductase, partial [Bryobacteraceae bacterium]